MPLVVPYLDKWPDTLDRTFLPQSVPIVDNAPRCESCAARHRVRNGSSLLFRRPVKQRMPMLLLKCSFRSGCMLVVVVVVVACWNVGDNVLVVAAAVADVT